jgi:hypothetical protein
MVVMGMSMGLGMIVPARIGTPFRLERPFHLYRGAAEASDHGGEDMIFGDPDGVRSDLGRDVPVPDMPDEALEGMIVRRPDLQQPFRRRLDPDEAAVIENQGVTVLQYGGFGQVEQEAEAADAPHGDPPPMAVAVVEHDAINDLAARERIVAEDAGGADHHARELGSRGM